MLQHLVLGQTKAKSLEIHQDLYGRWQGPNRLGHASLVVQVHLQRAESEVE